MAFGRLNLSWTVCPCLVSEGDVLETRMLFNKKMWGLNHKKIYLLIHSLHNTHTSL